MSSQIAASSVFAESSTPSSELVGRVLSDARRRALLRVLDGRTHVLELDRVAELVVAEELDGDWSRFDEERFDCVLVSLYREHLPLLDEAGFVDLDRTENGVFVHPDADLLDRVL
ncbi:DUF7344 domain-containing protein [Halomarina oriensis]|uniref:DUF7344 domain-containing protein n=1 Tax=Halomarina oriensis TaxID=671145 RepID=A0A6B0GEU1_9EURY|nr:hypothetical protein [Halomarina oriensis]MWG33060.1 hypothetical protein [Halomarina oriensis]